MPGLIRCAEKPGKPGSARMTFAWHSKSRTVSKREGDRVTQKHTNYRVKKLHDCPNKHARLAVSSGRRLSGINPELDFGHLMQLLAKLPQLFDVIQLGFDGRDSLLEHRNDLFQLHDTRPCLPSGFQ